MGIVSNKELKQSLEKCRTIEEIIGCLKTENISPNTDYISRLQSAYKDPTATGSTLTLSQLDKVVGGMKSLFYKKKEEDISFPLEELDRLEEQFFRTINGTSLEDCRKAFSEYENECIKVIKSIKLEEHPQHRLNILERLEEAQRNYNGAVKIISLKQKGHPGPIEPSVVEVTHPQKSLVQLVKGFQELCNKKDSIDIETFTSTYDELLTAFVIHMDAAYQAKKSEYLSVLNELCDDQRSIFSKLEPEIIYNETESLLKKLNSVCSGEVEGRQELAEKVQTLLIKGKIVAESYLRTDLLYKFEKLLKDKNLKSGIDYLKSFEAGQKSPDSELSLIIPPPMTISP